MKNNNSYGYPKIIVSGAIASAAICKTCIANCNTCFVIYDRKKPGRDKIKEDFPSFPGSHDNGFDNLKNYNAWERNSNSFHRGQIFKPNRKANFAHLQTGFSVHACTHVAKLHCAPVYEKLFVAG